MGFLSVVVVEVDPSKTFLSGLEHVEFKDVSGTLMSLFSLSEFKCSLLCVVI